MGSREDILGNCPGTITRLLGFDEVALYLYDKCSPVASGPTYEESGQLPSIAFVRIANSLIYPGWVCSQVVRVPVMEEYRYSVSYRVLLGQARSYFYRQLV